MARSERLIRSGEHQTLDDIGRNHADLESSVKAYFAPRCAASASRFGDYTDGEIAIEMSALLLEVERHSHLSIPASLEAVFRIDYLLRSERKLKDELSRAFREIYARKGARASLDEEILEAWKDRTSVPSGFISQLRRAFKYRHWLAHGRYWIPKLGRKHDFASLYVLAEAIFENFPLEGLDD